MPNKQDAVKAVALTAAGLALLTACGEPKATPMNDEYAGNSGESVQSQEEESQKDSGSSGSSDDTVKNHADDPNSTKSDNKDTGNYADGTYKINGQYGPVGEDTIDVKLTIKQGNVENVDIVGHPFTSISKKHSTKPWRWLVRKPQFLRHPDFATRRSEAAPFTYGQSTGLSA